MPFLVSVTGRVAHHIGATAVFAGLMAFVVLPASNLWAEVPLDRRTMELELVTGLSDQVLIPTVVKALHDRLGGNGNVTPLNGRRIKVEFTSSNQDFETHRRLVTTVGLFEIRALVSETQNSELAQRASEPTIGDQTLEVGGRKVVEWTHLRVAELGNEGLLIRGACGNREVLTFTPDRPLTGEYLTAAISKPGKGNDCILQLKLGKAGIDLLENLAAGSGESESKPPLALLLDGEVIGIVSEQEEKAASDRGLAFRMSDADCRVATTIALCGALPCEVREIGRVDAPTHSTGGDH